MFFQGAMFIVFAKCSRGYSLITDLKDFNLLHKFAHFKGLRLFFLSNFPEAMFIQGATFIPDSRVCEDFFHGPSGYYNNFSLYARVEISTTTTVTFTDVYQVSIAIPHDVWGEHNLNRYLHTYKDKDSFHLCLFNFNFILRFYFLL